MERGNFTRICRGLVALIVAGILVTPTAQAARQKPTAKTAWKQVTHASWYGSGFSGRRTASGGHFDPHHLTAAHRTLRLGSKVRVTDLGSGRSVVVQITDRGPFVRGRGIDLSYAAARQLGIVQRGVARVQIELVPPAKELPQAPIMVASSGLGSAWMPRAIVE